MGLVISQSSTILQLRQGESGFGSHFSTLQVPTAEHLVPIVLSTNHALDQTVLHDGIVKLIGDLQATDSRSHLSSIL